MAGMTIKSGLIALAFVTILSACVPQFRNHGYVPPQDEILALRPGVDTRESVAELVGPPTASGTLEGGDYYYVRSRFRTFGAFAPEEISREIVAMNFDAGGTLRNIERYGLEDGRAVVLSRRVTDDNLRDTTFLRQLLGNVGRFNAEDFLGEP